MERRLKNRRNKARSKREIDLREKNAELEGKLSDDINKLRNKKKELENMLKADMAVGTDPLDTDSRRGIDDKGGADLNRLNTTVL